MVWFCIIRNDLCETKLKSLSYGQFFRSIEDIKYCYSYLKYYRNHFSILPTQITQDTFISISLRLDLYQRIVNYFSNSIKSSGIKKMNNINPILVDYYVWNCIYCIIHKRYESTQRQDSFGCQIVFESHILSKDSNIFVIDSNKICKLLKTYKIDQLAQTNVFANYWLDIKRKQHKEQIQNQQINVENTILLMI